MLLAFFDGISAGDPVGGEIVGQEQHAEARESHLAESFKPGTNVGAVRHGAAAAIDDNVCRARDALRPFLQIVEAFRSGRRAVKDGTRNVRAFEERVKSHANDHGPV